MLLFASVATTYFSCDILLSFIMITLSRQYFVHSSNSYVATSIIMWQHSFSAASASWCRDPSFHVATASLFRLCFNIVMNYLHFYRDPESLSRYMLVAIELDFLLQLCSDVATLILGVVNICCRNPVSCREKTLLCSAYSFYCDPVCYVATELLCIVLKPLSRHRKVCRDLVSLCSAYFCVETLRSISRHRFISSSSSVLQR